VCVRTLRLVPTHMESCFAKLRRSFSRSCGKEQSMATVTPGAGGGGGGGGGGCGGLGGGGRAPQEGDSPGSHRPLFSRC